MIAISWNDYLKYGCVNCGCDSSRGGNFRTGDTHEATCRECQTNFVILNGTNKSSIGFSTNRKDENGKIIFEYPELQEHPRKGIPWHPWEQPDPRPDNGGEFWRSRGIGYDLSGFVFSKKAGERLLKMVKEVLEKEKPDSWLDWREFEPEWIQFKFQSTEFDLKKLDNMVKENNAIITKEILEKCKI